MRRLVSFVLFAVTLSGSAGLALGQQGMAPPDRPVKIDGYSELAALFASFQPCVVHARSTFGEAKERFRSGLEEGSKLSVAVRIRDGSGAVEQVFVRVDEIEGTLIFGVVESDVRLVGGFEAGSTVILSEEEILDWLITDREGNETGNLIGRYLDDLQDGLVKGKCDPSANDDLSESPSPEVAR